MYLYCYGWPKPCSTVRQIRKLLSSLPYSSGTQAMMLQSILSSKIDVSYLVSHFGTRFRRHRPDSGLPPLPSFAAPPR